MKRSGPKFFSSIGILVHFATGEISSYFREILAGILAALEGTSFDLKLITDSRFDRIQPLFEKHGVRGIIIPTAYRGILPNLARESRNQKTFWPVVTLNDSDPRLRLSQLGVDSFRAMQEITELMIRKGYRRFFFLGRKKGFSPDAEARFRGFLKALRRHRILFTRRNPFADGYFSEEEAYRQTLRFLRSKPAPRTVIVAANDAMAIGALKALGASHMRCPQDIAVTGFDGIDKTASTHPSLTTVHVPLKKIAREATCFLLR